MTGDGGEYLRAEDLRELGDDSLPGHYLDFSYMNNMNIDRYKNKPTLSSRLQYSSSPICSTVPQLMVKNTSQWHKQRQSKHQGCFTAGHNTLRFTKASIRGRDSSSKTCSQATRWGTGYVCHLFAWWTRFVYSVFLKRILRRKFPFLLCFFCRSRFCLKSTTRTLSVWVGVQSILIMLCCLPVCYTLGIQTHVYTHNHALHTLYCMYSFISC